MTPEQDSPMCTCGHSARWHTHGGTGVCDANGTCRCFGFVDDSGQWAEYDALVDGMDVEELRSALKREARLRAEAAA